MSKRFTYWNGFSSSLASYTTDFITETGISDVTIINALTAFEASLTSAGIIDYAFPASNKIRALYVIVGGTAALHKYNFLDPRDLDAAFRLTFFGGMSHSSTGMVGNGTTGYANTHLTPSTWLSQNDTHRSVYVRDNTAAPEVEIGAIVDFSNLLNISTRFSDSKMYYSANGPFTGVANSDSRGMFTASRLASGSNQAYKNGVLFDSSSQISKTLIGFDILLSARNISGTPRSNSSKEISLASVGSGMTATEASDYYNAVQTLQTSLSRQV